MMAALAGVTAGAPRLAAAQPCSRGSHPGPRAFLRRSSSEQAAGNYLRTSEGSQSVSAGMYVTSARTISIGT